MSALDDAIEDIDECVFWSGPVPVRNHKEALIKGARAELAALRSRNDRLELALARAKEQRDAAIASRHAVTVIERANAELAAILAEGEA